MDARLARSLNESFEQNGFVHIPRAISAQAVEEARDRIHQLLDERDKTASEGERNWTIRSGEIFTEPKLYGMIFQDEIVEYQRALLGDDFMMFPDFTIKKNQFTLSESGPKSGWHWDSSSEGKADYLCDPNYRVVKCGIYLQDNHVEFGGGIDVAPGGHKWPLLTKNVDLNFKFRRISDWLRITFSPQTVSLQAGDLLIFHSCLPHRSTTPEKVFRMATDEDRKHRTVADIPREFSKFTVYWDGARREFAETFWDNAIKQSEWAAANDRAESVNPFTKKKYPDDYPPHIVELFRESRINIPQG